MKSIPRNKRSLTIIKRVSNLNILLVIFLTSACGVVELPLKNKGPDSPSESTADADANRPKELQIQQYIDRNQLKKPEKMTELRAAFFLRRLRSESFIFNKQPDNRRNKDTEADGEKECGKDEFLGDLTYSKDSIFFKIEEDDLKHCDTNFQVAKTYLEFQLGEDAIEQLQSKYPNANDLILDTSESSIADITEFSYSTYRHIDTGNPTPSERIGLKTITFIGTEDFKACKKKSGSSEHSFIIDHCVEINVVTTRSHYNFEDWQPMPEGDIHEQHHYYKVVNKDLQGTIGSKYYDSGKMEIEFNNWKGTLTYSEANTPPTYNFTNNKGETISGILKEEIE